MRTIRKEVKMTIWLLATCVAIGALLLPSIVIEAQQMASNATQVATNSTRLRATRSTVASRELMGDPIELDTALDSRRDLMTAAGEHKKYILVKKKPKHKKIKMEIYKPKMKYKKIKMKVPVKKMKKKKVKGYLVKKEKHEY